MIRRRLFTILSVLSLLMCIALAVFWIRTYWRTDPTRTDSIALTRVRSYQAGAYRGNLWLEIWTMLESAEPDACVLPWSCELTLSYGDALLGPESEKFGIHLWHQGTGLPYTQIAYLRLPFWALCLAMSILPLLWMRARHRQRRRIRHGLCPVCGYDLRASTDRCPECGTAIPASSKTTKPEVFPS